MSDTKVISIPSENGGNGNIPAWMLPFMNGGYGGGFGGFGGSWGGGLLGFFLGLLFGNGGFGGFGGFGGNGGAGFLSNQMNNDNGRDLLMQAITSQGEQSRQATQTLSTMLGQDFNLVNSSIQTIQQSLSTIASQQGMNALQVINAIQSGNASMQSQLAQCCCQNQLALAEQTANLQQSMNGLGAQIGAGFSGVQQSIAAKSAADQLSTCQQTYALTDGANRNTQAILGKLDAMETRALQDKLEAARAENVRLAGEISQSRQNQAIAGMIGNAVNPLQAQLYGLNNTVESIKRCQPPVRTIVDNSYTAVPTIWANAVADNIVDRISAALTPTTETTTGAA